MKVRYLFVLERRSIEFGTEEERRKNEGARSPYIIHEGIAESVLLVCFVILTSNFLPTIILWEESIGRSRGIVNLGKAKAICLIHTLLIN